MARHEAEAARGREAAAVHQVGRCKLRQPDGEEEVEAQSRGGGGSGVTTGVMQQPAGKQEANMRGGMQEANNHRTKGGRAPRGQEAAVA